MGSSERSLQPSSLDTLIETASTRSGERVEGARKVMRDPLFLFPRTGLVQSLEWQVALPGLSESEIQCAESPP